MECSSADEEDKSKDIQDKIQSNTKSHNVAPTNNQKVFTELKRINAQMNDELKLINENETKIKELLKLPSDPISTKLTKNERKLLSNVANKSDSFLELEYEIENVESY